MGRYGMTQNGVSTPLSDGPIDLFRYTSPGTFDLNPEEGSYFSIDSGKTRINTFNGTQAGDLSDWAGPTPDSFNAFVSPGQMLPFSPGDRTLMDVIGYDPLPAPVPEAGPLVLVATSLIGFAVLRRRRVRPTS